MSELTKQCQERSFELLHRQFHEEITRMSELTSELHLIATRVAGKTDDKSQLKDGESKPPSTALEHFTVERLRLTEQNDRLVNIIDFFNRHF